MSKIATIGAVYDDGVTLIFPGETRASTKRYKVNTSARLAAGDRVKVWENAGTYVVEYKIGNKAEGGGGGSGISCEVIGTTLVFYSGATVDGTTLIL